MGNWWGFTTNQLDMPWLKSARDYASSKQYFDAVKPWRNRPLDPKPVGSRKQRTKTMREEPDGTIVFSLYRTDVVAFHPNGDVSVTGYPSVSTGMYLRAVGPADLYYQPYHRVLWTFPDGRVEWWTKDAQGQYHRNKHQRGMRLGQGDTVRLRRDKEHGWEPVDLTQLEPFDVPVPDKRKLKKIRDASGYTAFRKWLRQTREMIDALSIDGGNKTNTALCAQAIRRGDYGDAYQLLPRQRVWNSVTVAMGWQLTNTSFARLREYIYSQHDICTIEQKHILAAPEYAAMQRVRKTYCQGK